ncbi:MAG: hypothetical protein WAL71_16800 [Terriglobales bacterium]|jgi:hypothetical protein
MKTVGLLLLVVASTVFAQDMTLPSQQIQIPPKPTCVIILPHGSCADLWRQYNTALLQQYVARQKEAASAPLQQQVAELTKLTNDQQAQIKALHEEMDANATAAAQAKSDAHTLGMQQGAGYGATGTLFLVAIAVAIKKITSGYTVTKKEQARAASA